jgi:hypothetical protein
MTKIKTKNFLHCKSDIFSSASPATIRSKDFKYYGLQFGYQINNWAPLNFE